MATLARRGLNKVIMASFRMFESVGYHVTPNSFAYPIPDSSDLSGELFARSSDCVGLDWNLSCQEELLDGPFSRFATEVSIEQNIGLSKLDAAVLHSMIRHFRPEKVVEIGSGESTKFAARACLMNQKEGYVSQFVAIEPFPKQDLRQGIPGLTSLIEKRVEQVDPEEITDCDLLFIDSSHIIGIGGDVNYEILELVPRLKPGALVHWHDIFLPNEYPKTWVKDHHCFWTEQYLVHAFMKFNSDFEVLWASKYMHISQADRLQAVFPYFDSGKHQISSCWIRRKG